MDSCSGLAAAGFWRLPQVSPWQSALRQFLLPVTFDVTPLGLRRQSLGRVRLVPWQAVRAYRLRPTGVLLFQRTDPTAIDVVRSLFVPYPDDADELLLAIRLYLQHAVELD